MKQTIKVEEKPQMDGVKAPTIFEQLQFVNEKAHPPLSSSRDAAAIFLERHHCLMEHFHKPEPF